ncbi:MAG: beta-propeller domain-containing protein [Sulfolobales archaeon]
MLTRRLIYLLGALSIILGLSLSLALPFLYKTSFEIEKYRSIHSLNTSTPGVVVLMQKNLSDYIKLYELINSSISNIDFTQNIIQGGFPLPQQLPMQLAITVTLLSASIQTSRGTSTEYSKTNVQVEGIDECDIVKNNDRYIFALLSHKKSIYIFDSFENKIISRIEFREPVWNRLIGLYLYKNQLILIGEISQYGTVLEVSRNIQFITPNISTVILVYDVSDVSKPILIKNFSVSGVYLSSRLNEPYLYIISTTNSFVNKMPVIPLINYMPVPVDKISVLSNVTGFYTNVLAIDLNTFNYDLSSYLTDPGSRIYMSNKHLYIVSTPVRIYPLAELFNRLYQVYLKYIPRETLDKLFRDPIKFYEEISNLDINVAQLSKELSNEIPREITVSDSTKVYVYDVNGLSIKPRSSFIINGSILDQFSMEEYKERYFIVATTQNLYKLTLTVQNITIPREYIQTIKEPITIIRINCSNTICVTAVYRDSQERSATTTQIPEIKIKEFPVVGVFPRMFMTSNNVYIIDIESNKVVSALTGLAENERIYSARLLLNIFYLVTFRTIDPLYAIDISNPEKPRILGYLKIPGVSIYLHPLYQDRLLGVGLEDNSVKISLFDISDPANIKEIAALKITNHHLPLQWDYHAFTIYRSKQIFIIPAMTFGKGDFIIINYTRDTLDVKDIIKVSAPLRSVYIGEKIYLISATSIKIYDINKGVEKEISLE